MAFITHRTSRGKKYWSIVESRRVNGKPRQIILEYLGTAETLLARLTQEKQLSLKSYSHGDSAALLNIAKELDIVSIINRHVPKGTSGKKPQRDSLTVGASFLLAAIGRACRPTSKMGWYDWCQTTSMEYGLKTSLKKLDSQHFWDQMNALPAESIPLIEEDIVKQLAKQCNVKPDTLLFDTSNFFTFIDSTNERCQLAQRGHNKQKRYDLRQIGLALLVSRKGHLPLFHRTYPGNQADVTVFKDMLGDLTKRMKAVFEEMSQVTLVFDKGNNSRDNFKAIDEKKDLHYVAGLVSSNFKWLIDDANQGFESITLNGEEVPVYRSQEDIWGQKRSCVVYISRQLKEGQIRGIHQQLEKKLKELEGFKTQLENPRSRKKMAREGIERKLKTIIRGQFVGEILKTDPVELTNGALSFSYSIDGEAFERLKNEVLGRNILITSRHDWSTEDILQAYRGQARVEYAFRNMKNPFHMAVRPQYHWTDQKIRVHILMCMIAYLLSMTAYMKARKAGYGKNPDRLLEELGQIRLACQMKKGSRKVAYRLEQMPEDLNILAKSLGISDENIRLDLNISDYS